MIRVLKIIASVFVVALTIVIIATGLTGIGHFIYSFYININSIMRWSFYFILDWLLLNWITEAEE